MTSKSEPYILAFKQLYIFIQVLKIRYLINTQVFLPKIYLWFSIFSSSGESMAFVPL